MTYREIDYNLDDLNALAAEGWRLVAAIRRAPGFPAKMVLGWEAVAEAAAAPKATATRKPKAK
jgi:hypothetical protein